MRDHLKFSTFYNLSINIDSQPNLDIQLFDFAMSFIFTIRQHQLNLSIHKDCDYLICLLSKCLQII